MTRQEARSSPSTVHWVSRGTGAYRRISTAFFLAGFASLSLLYCVQPLLPALALQFGVGPAESSFALSFSTGFLAVAVLFAAMVSEGLGRRGLMFGAMAGAALLNVAAALAPHWHMLLAVRALEGFVLGGVPAVAMAYLAEEIDPRGLGFSMGLFVAGSGFGGMIGRVGTGFIAEFYSWRVALAVIGIAGFTAAIAFFILLPPSRNFVRRPGFSPRHHARAWWGHLRRPGLPLLFVVGFLAMGAFVAVYNYIGFRLMAPPYNLSQSELGSIFLIYLFGVVASSAAGALVDRIGRHRVLPAGLVVTAAGAALTLLHDLTAVIAGVIVLTVGFFIAHSVASGWVGQLAVGAKGHASSLYILAFYLGSSIAGSLGGWFWADGGWPALVAFTLVLLASGLAAALRLNALARPS
jgi:YNFM family putative membrane transporter